MTARLTDADRRRIQALAWVVLLSAFAIFLVGAVGGPWLVWRYLRTATVEETAYAEPRTGSVTLESVAGILVLREGEGPQQVFEGTTVSTDGAARAFLRFFDGSTLSLEPNTRLTVRRLRRQRFGLGNLERRIELVVDAQPGSQGGLSAGTTWGEVAFVLTAPGRGQVILSPESHVRLELAEDRLRVITIEGLVTVGNAGSSVRVKSDQRTDVVAGQPPTPPTSAAEDILANGDFDVLPLQANGWSFERYPSGLLVQVPGESRQETTPEGRTVVTFDRQGSGGRPADMYYRQLLGNRDISGSTFLGVTATLRVLDQSLPGGGRGSPPTEFPLILKLIFESGVREQLWAVGFYAVPPSPEDPGSEVLQMGQVQLPDGVWSFVRVPKGEWFEFESGNLLEGTNPYSLAPPGRTLQRPLRLRRLEVVASGHDYYSQVDRVAVWVK